MPSLSSSRLPSRRVTRWLWRALRGNRRQVLLNILLDIAGVAVSLAAVWAIQRAIDVATGQTAGSIYLAVAVMAGLMVCRYAVRIALVWVSNILGVRAQNRMQQHLMSHLLRTQWLALRNRHSGDLVNRLELDVRTVVSFCTEVLPDALSTVLLFLGAFTYMFCMDHWLAVLMVAIIPVAIAFSRLYVARLRRLTHAVRAADSAIQSLLQETVQQQTLIKSLEGEEEATARLGTVQDDLQTMVRRRTKVSIFGTFIVNFGFAIGYLVAFLWGALRLSASTLSFGGMVAFLQLVNRLQHPARDMMSLIPAVAAVAAAAERLMEIEETPLEEQGEACPVAAPCGLRMNDVSFAYDDGTPVLAHLSYDFPPGQCTAICGTTGAGKTTILRLLLALIAPQEGTVEIYSPAGEAVAVSPRHRCNFVYVPQGNTLMSGTIRENLLLGDTHASDKRLAEVLHLCCADFVFTLPDGLDTRCGEGGGGLSEGQCQRLSIARALLRRRPLLLLDEATSAVDAATEQQLLTNILSSRAHTVILVTHRPAALAFCDTLLTLGEEGQA